MGNFPLFKTPDFSLSEPNQTEKTIIQKRLVGSLQELQICCVNNWIGHMGGADRLAHRM